MNIARSIGKAMKFWISAFVFVLTIGIGECETSHRSVVLMTNDSIIGIDLNEPSKPMFHYEISRNLEVDSYKNFDLKPVSSSSKEMIFVDTNAIVSLDFSDTASIKQKVMFNSSTYSGVNIHNEAFYDELYKGRNYITGMTVDPLTSTTYFTTSNLISVMNSEGKWRTLIEFEANGWTLYDIRDICLIQSENRLYWLSNRTNLFTAFTDGSNVRQLDVNLHYGDFIQMVADQYKKVLYLLSKSDRIVVVNTKPLKVKIYEKAARSIAVDSKTGDVFITEFDTINKEMVLKKFDPLSVLESSLSIRLPDSSSKNSIVVHHKGENWTKCKDCDGICLRKRDSTTICECPQDLVRDQKSGKCKTPEKRFFFLSYDRRIVSLAWPDETNQHSINIAGNAIDFLHFAVDYTRDLVYGMTFENALWKFSSNGTFIGKTVDSTDISMEALDVDVVTGNVVVMTQKLVKKSSTSDLCHIAMYNHNLEKIYLIRQNHLMCGQRIEVDEINGKIFYSTPIDVRSANMNGKDVKVILSERHPEFSLDKKHRRVFYKRWSENHIECIDYNGENQNASVVLPLKKIRSFKINNDELYAFNDQKSVSRAIRNLEGFTQVEEISVYMVFKETKIAIIDASQPKPLTECSHQNGGCEGFCVVGDGKKQCLCKDNHWRLNGKCANHSQFLAFLDTKYISLFNPDNNSYEPRDSIIRPICYHKNTNKPTSLAISNKTNEIYYSEKGGIFSMNLDGQNCEPVVKIDGIATGLTLDVSSQDLYFINDNKYQIMKVNLETEDRTLTVVYESKNRKDFFAHLQYEECTKSLYFSNNNQNGASIESFKIEGSDHKTIVQKLDFVYGLTLDREARKIYYSHLKRKQVTRCDYNGEFSEDLMYADDILSQYGDIAIVNNNLIFLHNGSEFVAIHKNNMEDRRTILQVNRDLTFLAAIDMSQEKCPDDPCTNNDLSCSGFCRSSSSGEGVCACNKPEMLEEDEKTCSIPKTTTTTTTTQATTTTQVLSFSHLDALEENREVIIAFVCLLLAIIVIASVICWKFPRYRSLLRCRPPLTPRPLGDGEELHEMMGVVGQAISHDPPLLRN